MPIINPTQLVEEYKKSGEFDRLRKELFAQFRDSDTMVQLLSRVEDITKQKLSSDQKLNYMPEAAVFRELMQELDRYPILERAVADVPAFSDPAFASGVRASAKRILEEDRKVNPSPQPHADGSAPAATHGLNTGAATQTDVTEDEKARAVRFAEADNGLLGGDMDVETSESESET